MDKYEKALTKKQLEEEKKVLQELKNTYEKAKKEVQQKIADLDARTDMQNLQSIVYQKKYQEAILTQIDEIINLLGSNTYDTVEEYIKDSYINGYAGNMWLLQMQTGCTVCVPIDQKKIQRAMTNDIHLSSKYYKTNPLKGRLVKEDVKALKKSIQSELSAGIVAGKTWKEVAYQVAQGMNSPFKKAMNDAMRIARTEGHRVNQQGFLDACYEAKDKGADIVKQWDSTLDGFTRPWHREADGQIRELNEKFIVDGEEMDAPSIGGSARNVCNCRCQLLQRARWALDEKELQTLKDKASYFGLDKNDQFEEFKKKYLNLPKNTDNIKVQTDDSTRIVFKEAKTIKEAEQYVTDTCGIKMTSYKGVDLKVANAMNESLTNALNYCPELKERMGFYGSAQERNKLFKKDLEDFYYRYFLKAGYSEMYSEMYAKSYASRAVGKVSGSTFAFASSGGCTSKDAEFIAICKKYSGICVNNTFGKNYDSFKSDVARCVVSKWHPIGTTTVQSVFDHEFGHQLDYLFDLRNDKEIQKMYYSRKKSEIKEELSEYGAENIKEFIAEAYAEYLNNPTPREISKSIGEIIERNVKK